MDYLSKEGMKKRTPEEMDRVIDQLEALDAKHQMSLPHMIIWGIIALLGIWSLLNQMCNLER